MGGFSGAFDIETYHKRKKDFLLPAFSVNVYAGEAKERTESPHPVLHQRLENSGIIFVLKLICPILLPGQTPLMK